MFFKSKWEQANVNNTTNHPMMLNAARYGEMHGAGGNSLKTSQDGQRARSKTGSQVVTGTQGGGLPNRPTTAVIK